MNPEDFFTFANSSHNTRGHSYKLLPSHCRVNVRKGFLQKGQLSHGTIYLLNYTIVVTVQYCFQY